MYTSQLLQMNAFVRIVLASEEETALNRFDDRIHFLYLNGTKTAEESDRNRLAHLLRD